MRGRSSSRFVARGTSLEPVAADLGYDHTPVDDFFVCKVGEVPDPDPAHWRLLVDGDGVERTLTLDLDDLSGLPQRRVDAWLECAGNGRALFGEIGVRPLEPENNQTPWMLGGMGMGTWEGPSLGAVLQQAGVRGDAAWVSPAGLDWPNDEGEPVRMSLPLGKAQHPDTIVALAMNGASLEPMHGFPARLVVPGWIGAYSVKWLGRIEVSASWVGSYRADTYYRLRSPDGEDLGPATTHPVKSSLALPWPAELVAGAQKIAGYARVGEGSVARVEWKVDGGEWHDARLRPRPGEWGWQPFDIEWVATAGSHLIRTRATTDSGVTQPDEMPFHRNGLLWNAVIPHPVEVT